MKARAPRIIWFINKKRHWFDRGSRNIQPAVDALNHAGYCAHTSTCRGEILQLNLALNVVVEGRGKHGYFGKGIVKKEIPVEKRDPYDALILGVASLERHSYLSPRYIVDHVGLMRRDGLRIPIICYEADPNYDMTPVHEGIKRVDALPRKEPYITFRGSEPNWYQGTARSPTELVDVVHSLIGV